jgi:aryl-alcohol dehydrogenase-like predicted oxidoreductase
VERGCPHYDTSRWYGLGLCERRFGNFLHTKDRSDYVLSSKVGKLLKASRQNNAKENFPFTPSPNNLVFDYTEDGVKRSIEDSLQRLGVDALDIVFVHDLSPDNPYCLDSRPRLRFPRRAQMDFRRLNDLMNELLHGGRMLSRAKNRRDFRDDRFAGQRPESDVRHVNDGCQDARNDGNSGTERDLCQNSEQAAGG